MVADSKKENKKIMDPVYISTTFHIQLSELFAFSTSVYKMLEDEQHKWHSISTAPPAPTKEWLELCLLLHISVKTNIQRKAPSLSIGKTIASVCTNFETTSRRKQQLSGMVCKFIVSVVY